jgi:hypothetical protein
MFEFFVGLHQPSDARHFDKCCISVNRLRNRKSDFAVRKWIMDSGAFSEISRNGGYSRPPQEYARQIRRWSAVGDQVAAASQDWMVEPEILRRTGLTMRDHQRLTIERFDSLRDCDLGAAHLMPVLQGQLPEHYVRHLDQYGARIESGSRVGVGSVCKRNGSARETRAILRAIKSHRPSLRLHGFGLKKTALRWFSVRRYLATADSMAWSFAARKRGADPNDWREARRFAEQIDKRRFWGADGRPLDADLADETFGSLFPSDLGGCRDLGFEGNALNV